MINIARQVQLLVPGIVMVAEKIVRLHDVHIMNLGRLQNFASALRAGNVRARPHLAPFSERAGHTDLRPNSEDQRDADVKQPVRTQAKTGWIKHVSLNLTRKGKLPLYRSEIRRP